MSLPTPQEQQQLAVVNPELQAAMQSPEFLSLPQTDYSDPIKGIMALRNMMDLFSKVPPDARVIESAQTFTTRDGATLKLLVFSPATATQGTKLPLLVWYYGGGGCCGSPENATAFCRNVVLNQNCIAICPQYRLAPEHKFPAGIHDCWDALEYVAHNASNFNADPTRGFIIGGESFGGVLSAVTMLRARDENLQPPLTGAFLSAASFIPPYAVPEAYKPHYLSRFDPVCLAAPGLTEAAKKAFDLALQPDYTSPEYRAILWPTGHGGLPKTYLQTCGMDINRDESIIYEDVLRKAGVETRLDVYPGCPHVFWWLFPKAEVTRTWEADTKKGFEWLFSG